MDDGQWGIVSKFSDVLSIFATTLSVYTALTVRSLRNRYLGKVRAPELANELALALEDYKTLTSLGSADTLARIRLETKLDTKYGEIIQVLSANWMTRRQQMAAYDNQVKGATPEAALNARYRLGAELLEKLESRVAIDRHEEKI